MEFDLIGLLIIEEEFIICTKRINIEGIDQQPQHTFHSLDLLNVQVEKFPCEGGWRDDISSTALSSTFALITSVAFCRMK